MEYEKQPDPTLFVIFGASGDLTRRKLVPALYNLYVDGWMPEKFEVIGISSKEMSDMKFRDYLRNGVNEISRHGKVKEEDWKNFAQCLHYTSMDLTDAKVYKNLAKTLSVLQKKWGTEA
jgi:glucose-6-phosphate 1-dehydrogenase